MSVLNNMNVIQASEDARINESAFLQLHALKKEMGSKFDVNKPYFLMKYGAGSTANAEKEVRNAMSDLGVKESLQNVMVDKLGRDILRFKVMEADEGKLGGFTYKKCQEAHDKMFKGSAQEFKNSLIDGVPFTFGINTVNVRMPQPEVTSYDFLSGYELGVPTGNTLFGASEVINTISFKGSPTDITNGATTLGAAAWGGNQELSPYKVTGISIAELQSFVDSTASGYAGDNLIQTVFGKGLEVAKRKMQNAIMRDFYAGLESAVDSSGNSLVPTYKLSDITDGAITDTSLTKLFSTSAGLGDFITKVVQAVNAPQNSWLDTNQRMLSRIVAHTSFAPAFERNIPTLGLSGDTTGQTTAGGMSLKDALKGVDVYFGGDICASSNPAEDDLRMLFVSDPSINGYKSDEYGFAWIVIALAPTIMATYSGAGFQNQMFLTRYTTPVVNLANSAFFLKGN